MIYCIFKILQCFELKLTDFGYLDGIKLIVMGFEFFPLQSCAMEISEPLDEIAY